MKIFLEDKNQMIQIVKYKKANLKSADRSPLRVPKHAEDGDIDEHQRRRGRVSWKLT